LLLNEAVLRHGLTNLANGGLNFRTPYSVDFGLDVLVEGVGP